MASETSSTQPTKDAVLGPLIRMRALTVDQLPSNSALQAGNERSDVASFAASALDEAERFMTGYLPAKFNVRSEDKRSPPSNSPIKLFQHDISASALPKNTVAKAPADNHGGESWFARESLHENKAQDETASWEEFDHGLRVDHSQHEMDYTPTVEDAHQVMNWNEELEKHGRKTGQWEDVNVEVREMVHKIPAPLNNRVFPVVLVTGKRSTASGVAGESSEGSFLVVQIPLATQGLPNAKYHNVPKVTGGIYVSIERVELVEAGRRVKWQMATASDAKGVLPMWAQKMGVPGAVVKDVGFFIQWVSQNRNKGRQ